nr:MAG TPA: Nucleoside 2-deoxyribosyltransferase like protein [Caudoviricetes sp.]
MKRLAKKQLTVINSRESIPNNLEKSIFLAGPTPRDYSKISTWRTEAIEILKKLNYDGVVFIPEERNGNFPVEKLNEQIDWEIETMSSCDAIVFWIPRMLRDDFEFIGLTTNVEFGRFLNSNKLFIGSPENAEKNSYLKYISRDKYEWHNDLNSLLKDVVEYLGNGIYREDVEVKIPKHIFESKQFQNWYIPQKAIGNYLTDFNMEYEFVMPKMKKLFMAIFKPSVYVKESAFGIEENRVKDNEFVIARTNMSYICAYKKADEILDSQIVLCEEFRTPVMNKHEMIFELIGGSSFNENDDELTVASQEFEEESGLKVDSSRFSPVALKQSAGTLCSHQIKLYKVELTEDELYHFKNDTETHGVVEDTERIHIHVMTFREAMSLLDWTNVGMIYAALSEV